jgi:hypothetical protein
MTFDILTFIAILVSFFAFSGYAYWRGYRKGYRDGSRPTGGWAIGYAAHGAGGSGGIVAGGGGAAQSIPDYEDGSPMP